MTAALVERDERTIAIENAGYRWSYLVLSFGILAIIAFRWFLGESMPWEFLALVVISGGVNAAIQAWHQTVFKRWVGLALATATAGGAIAALLAFLRH